MSFSPTGKQFVPYEGPLDAKIVLIGESPVEDESGRVSRVLDALLQQAGLSRASLRLVNAIPCHGPHSDADVAWGRALLKAELERAIASGAKLLMPLGNLSLEWLCPQLPFPPRWSDDDGEEERGRIMAWRGSLFPLNDPPVDVASYDRAIRPQSGVYVLPTFHPAAIAKQFEWHPWGVLDFEKAARFISGRWEWPRPRKWYVNAYHELPRFIDEVLIKKEHLVAVDSEMSPYPIISLASEHEVHVFGWDDSARAPLERLFSSQWVLKVAHNAGHDWTWLREAHGINVVWPCVDTSGNAHILDCSLPRNLKPAIATRFTSLPYWAWMVQQDPKRYCGWDSIGCYDAYWAQMRRIIDVGRLNVTEHDHLLLKHLLNMQWKGVKIDEVARREALTIVKRDLALVKWRWRGLVRNVVRTKVMKFEKPHLFYSSVSCPCCGGGKVVKAHCWRCGNLPKKPENKNDYFFVQQAGVKAPTVAVLRSALPPCVRCKASGKIIVWHALHGEKKASPYMTADILYRGLGIGARRYKGKPTVRADQLDPLRVEHPAVDMYCRMSELAAQHTTMDRLTPDPRTGRTHPVFDPWGTASGRTASSGGLVQRGTNIQNLEKKYRNVLVADKGFLLVAPDKAQVEGRAIAAASGDATMRRVYFEELVDWPGNKRHGTIDAHTKVMQVYLRLCGKAISRDQAKRQTYAMFYGATPEQLAVELNAEYARKAEGCLVTALDTTRVLGYLWDLFGGVKRWQERMFNECFRTRRVTSPTGRVRTWNGYIGASKKEAREGHLLKRDIEKDIRSFPPQDMAAWVLAEDLDAIIVRGKGLVEPLIHVHDELVVQIPEGPGRIVDEACALIKDCMTRTLWGIEFPVDNINPQPNWWAAKGGE